MRSTRRPRSRALTTLMAMSIVAVIALLIGNILGGGFPDRARADSISQGVAVTCTSPIGPIEAEIPTTASDEPDPVVAGEEMTIAYQTDYPAVVQDSFVINSARAVWPMPGQVTVDDVEFEGGDPRFTAEYEITEDSVITTVTGDGTTDNRPVTPTIVITATVDDDATGTLIWPVFASFTSNADTFVGNVDSTCTPDDPSVVLNTTAVEGSPEPPPTTVPPPTTTVPGEEPPPTTTVPGEEPPPPTTTVPPPTTTVPGEEPPPPTTTVPTPPPTTVPPPGGGSPIPGLPEIPGLSELSPEQLQALLQQLGLPPLSPEQFLQLFGQLPPPPSVTIESETSGTIGPSQFESLFKLKLF